MQLNALCNRAGIVPLLPVHTGGSRQHRSRFTQTLRVMRLTAFILLVSVLHVAAAGTAQTVTLTAKNASLEKVLGSVKAQTGYFFLYKPSQLKEAKPVTIK